MTCITLSIGCWVSKHKKKRLGAVTVIRGRLEHSGPGFPFCRDFFEVYMRLFLSLFEWSPIVPSWS